MTRSDELFSVVLAAALRYQHPVTLGLRGGETLTGTFRTPAADPLGFGVVVLDVAEAGVVVFDVADIVTLTLQRQAGTFRADRGYLWSQP